MEPGEALATAAQIAVALAGVAGVVVAFRTGFGDYFAGSVNSVGCGDRRNNR